LALLGFHRITDHPLRSKLCMFDITGARDVPIWSAQVETADLPASLLDRKFKGEQQFPARVLVGDIFPERSGLEIAVAFQDITTTHGPLRIYDLQGELLYQVWLDAQVNSLYWMSGPRLLVMAGNDGKGFWADRGYEGDFTAHPRVVFAVKPEVGFCSGEYLLESPGDTPLHPAWYKCLWPPELVEDYTCGIQLLVAPVRADARSSVGASIECLGSDHSLPEAALSITINEHGLADYRQLSNNFIVYQDRLPDPNELLLRDLPPLIRKPSNISRLEPQTVSTDESP
jgi:hypothetical protein